VFVLIVNPAAITQQETSFNDDDDRKLKRGVLPKRATQIMKSWLFQHIAVSFRPPCWLVKIGHFALLWYIVNRLLISCGSVY